MFDNPPVISPVAAFIEAVSVGATAKVNVPPVVPRITGTPPSHVGEIVNIASSVVKTVNVSVELEGQAPFVV